MKQKNLGPPILFARTTIIEPASTDTITSTANAEVKRLRSLHERKFRRQTGWFLAEGMRICTEAVALGWRMHRLAYLASRAGEDQVQALLEALARDGGRRLGAAPLEQV